jgi:hypothetical protein
MAHSWQLKFFPFELCQGCGNPSACVLLASFALRSPAMRPSWSDSKSILSRVPFLSIEPPTTARSLFSSRLPPEFLPDHSPRPLLTATVRIARQRCRPIYCGAWSLFSFERGRIWIRFTCHGTATVIEARASVGVRHG